MTRPSFSKGRHLFYRVHITENRQARFLPPSQPGGLPEETITRVKLAWWIIISCRQMTQRVITFVIRYITGKIRNSDERVMLTSIEGAPVISRYIIFLSKKNCILNVYNKIRHSRPSFDRIGIILILIRWIR